MPLPRRVLGRTGLAVSALGFGCAGFWAKKIFPERDALSLLEKAVEQGVNVFDTSPSYADGNAERRLGLMLRSTGHRADFVICSKVGRHATESGRLIWLPAAVDSSVRRSLERLDISRLDVLHLHGPAPEDLRPSLLEKLSDLRQEGLIGYLGISSHHPDVVRLALETGFFDSYMVDYSVIRKQNKTLLSEIAASGAGAVVMRPVARALFRGSFFPSSLKTLWEIARIVRWRGADFGAARQYRFLNDFPGGTGAQWALAFVLNTGTFATAFFGTTSARHLEENLAAVQLTIPDELLRRIESLPDS